MIHPTPRPKLAILYGPLMHYRIALFDALCDHYDVTVFATSNEGPQNGLRFGVEVVAPRKLGRFQFQPGLRRRLRQDRFDVCIVFLDVAYLSALGVVFFPVARRTFVWGVWLTAAELANRLRLAAIARSEGAIFYCQHHLEEVAARGADCEKLYVAPNTVGMPETVLPSAGTVRNSILFVGTFAARKGLDRLVRIFASLLPQLRQEVRLVLVGDGPERARLEALISDLGLGTRVEMPGRVNDPAELAPYYSRALVAVSLSQAGLSVLQSMGFGVPFLTILGSLSGGETLNIVDGVNGFLVENSDKAITEGLLASTRDPQRAAAMGVAAQDHYLRYATIGNYAQGFFDALEGTRKTSIWSGGSPPGASPRPITQRGIG